MTKLTSANICQLSAIGQMNKEIEILTYKLRQGYLGEQRTLSLPPPPPNISECKCLIKVLSVPFSHDYFNSTVLLHSINNTLTVL